MILILLLTGGQTRFVFSVFKKIWKISSDIREKIMTYIILETKVFEFRVIKLKYI
jgi:hypothetical protein